MKIPKHERAWTAGFFEGEGSVRIARNGSNRTHGVLTIEISQVDATPLAWIAERWGGVVHTVKPRGGKMRPFYRWVVVTNAAVGFIRSIEPFIVRGEVKEKIALALAFQAQKVSTHANRTEEYRSRQEDFIVAMAKMNRRGAPEVEREALTARL